MNKQQAAALLGISAKTLQRGVASGKYKCTRTGTPPFTTLSFTRADLGLPDDPSFCIQCAADQDCFNPECACAVCEAASIAIDAMEPAPSAVRAEVTLPYQDDPVRAPERPVAPVVAISTNEEIMREAQERGCLIKNHPDLKRVQREVLPPNITPMRGFHQPRTVELNWREQKAKVPTGYTSEVENPDWLATIQFKGGKLV